MSIIGRSPFKPFVPQPKQEELINAILSGEFSTIFFGGAAGGGKTYGAIGAFILLCKLFPGSRWAVMRQDYSKLKNTSIKTYNRIVPSRFHKSFSQGVATMVNGSEILFLGENFKQNKELTHMDGLEVNGILMEEVQELQDKTFEKAKLRAGRWIIPGGPPPLVLLTGNPSQNWSKKLIIEPWRQGKLNPKYKFIPAAMSDNKELPASYLEALETLDSITYARYVLGDWDAIDVDNPFCYDFVAKKHVREFAGPTKKYPLYLSFDFNRDPITCIVAQHNEKKIRIHHEYRIGKSHIGELCDRIRADWAGHYVYITGDATGKSGSSLVESNVNHYTIIKKKLGIPWERILVKKSNPPVKITRILTNSLFKNHPDLAIHPRCEYLIADNQYVEVDAKGEINKTKDKRITHLLDCERYYFNTFHRKFLKAIL
jgi:hypothetical protein